MILSRPVLSETVAPSEKRGRGEQIADALATPQEMAVAVECHRGMAYG
jgi:hypothetical protein